HAELARLGPAGRDLMNAMIHARACIAAAQDSGRQRLISAALECFAALQLEAGRYHTGVRLLAAVRAWRDATHVRHHGGGAPWMTVPSRLEQARAMLGEAAFTDAWRAGTVPLEQALELALAATQPPQTQPAQPPDESRKR